MPPRFHAPDLDPARGTVTLPAGEGHHLTRVLRLGPGADVEVFDGRGTVHAGIVATARPTGVDVRIGPALPAQAEPPHRITVCPAVLKGDAMDAVVRDATVLGAVRIVPVVTGRTNALRTGAAAGRAMERWHRVAVAAAKQCGRAVLPAIDPVCPFDLLLRRTCTSDEGAVQRLLLVEPAAAVDQQTPRHPSSGPVCLASGPEGGWAPDEIAGACAAGWQPWSLGPFTLRAEHVVLAALAVVRHAWGR